MKKTAVVYNACYGGFSLSRAAVLRARELSNNPTWGEACIKGDLYPGGEVCNEDYGSISGISRHDLILVAVVRELGDEANGSCAELSINNISGNMYRITEYDGAESVETPTTVDWVVVPKEE